MIWGARGSIAEEKDEAMSAELDADGLLPILPPFKAG